MLHWVSLYSSHRYWASLTLITAIVLLTPRYRHVIICFLRVNSISRIHDLVKEPPFRKYGTRRRKVVSIHAAEMERMYLTMSLWDDYPSFHNSTPFSVVACHIAAMELAKSVHYSELLRSTIFLSLSTSMSAQPCFPEYLGIPYSFSGATTHP